MAGILVPKPFPPGKTFRDNRKLSEPPSTETFDEACVTCAQKGHKGIDCPAGIKAMSDGTKRVSHRHMFDKGHFTETGHHKI